MFSTTTDLIMQFFTVAEKVEGRIKLQKIIYILQTKGVIDFELDYTYALYGPYSEDLQLEIEYLVTIGYLKEFIEGNTYNYELNKNFPISITADENISSNRGLISELLNKESQLLEVTSTIYYLKSYNYEGEEEISQKLKLLKPNLEDKISSAFELYSALESE
jgi:uncharacterized protein YwgA